MKSFSIIVALDEKNGIGKDNDLAWRLSGDLKHFKQITTHVKDPAKQNAVIMGRKTWDSLPEVFRPLPGRLNVVLSRNRDLKGSQEAEIFFSLEEALRVISFYEKIEDIFVIGGAQIYAQAIAHPACTCLYITHLRGDFNCDAAFPAIPSDFKEKEASAWFKEGDLAYQFKLYQRS
jgi:dihydrofolate reductase